MTRVRVGWGHVASHSVRFTRASGGIDQRPVRKRTVPERCGLSGDGRQGRFVRGHGREHGRSCAVDHARCLCDTAHEHAQPPPVPPAGRRRLDPPSREPRFDQRGQRHADESAPVGCEPGGRHCDGQRAKSVPFAQDDVERRPSVPRRACRRRGRRATHRCAGLARAAAECDDRRDEHDGACSRPRHLVLLTGAPSSAALARTKLAMRRIGTRVGQRASSSARRSSVTASNERAAAS